MRLEKMANTVTRWFVAYGFFIIGFAIPTSGDPVRVFIHELGHAILGIGIIEGPQTEVLLDWFPSAVGSLISTTAAAWLIARYGTRLFPYLGLTGVGWAVRNTAQVFFEDGGEYGADMKTLTALWYPTALICLGVVITTYIKEKRKWQVQRTSKGQDREPETRTAPQGRCLG